VKDSFSQALKWVLVDEGGDDDDPVDPGGRTSRGITQREYNAWKKLRGETPHDVWTATDAEVAEIYQEQYWNPYCDRFPVGLDYLYFDAAVNMGPNRAAVLLQRAIGVSSDGRIGPVTMSAVMDANPADVINEMSKEKTKFYRSLRTFWKFGRGWLNRVAHVQKNALSMVVDA
jgi:lysozyme family protein